MATKPTDAVPTWATSATGIARTVDPGANSNDGYDVADRPPAGWVNYMLSRIGQWLEYSEEITDEHQVIVDDAVRKTVADTIAAVKSMGAGGIIAALAAKPDTEALITDARSDFVKLYEMPSPGGFSAGAIRFFVSASYGFVITVNADHDGAGNFTRTSGTSYMLTLGGHSAVGGDSFVTASYQTSAAADTWAEGAWGHESRWKMDENGLQMKARDLTVDLLIPKSSTPTLAKVTKPALVKAHGVIDLLSGSPAVLNGYNLGTPSVASNLLLVPYKTSVAVSGEPSVTVSTSASSVVAKIAVSSTGQAQIRFLDSSLNTVDAATLTGKLHIQVFSEDT